MPAGGGRYSGWAPAHHCAPCPRDGLTVTLRGPPPPPRACFSQRHNPAANHGPRRAPTAAAQQAAAVGGDAGGQAALPGRPAPAPRGSGQRRQRRRQGEGELRLAGGEEDVGCQALRRPRHAPLQCGDAWLQAARAVTPPLHVGAHRCVCPCRLPPPQQWRRQRALVLHLHCALRTRAPHMHMPVRFEQARWSLACPCRVVWHPHCTHGMRASSQAPLQTQHPTDPPCVASL